ncbi:hypothetical protein [Thalassotalea sp. PLHSN55]|uniref:hypothetical protein n=1 Tax=Thalassotalea sp. PLHSN55 TaxID=3435888 RepID=UPI003F82550B
MRELNVNEIEQVNGGVVALAWAVYGAYRAYQAYKAVRFVTNAVAGGALYDGIKSGLGDQ